MAGLCQEPSGTGGNHLQPPCHANQFSGETFHCECTVVFGSNATQLLKMTSFMMNILQNCLKHGISSAGKSLQIFYTVTF